MHSVFTELQKKVDSLSLLEEKVNLLEEVETVSEML